MNNTENNVVAVGPMGSGKTMYLVGIYNMFSRILGEFTISSLKADGEKHFLTECWENLISGIFFPDVTDCIVKYDLCLSHCYRPLLDFGYIDCPGMYFKEYDDRYFVDRELMKIRVDSTSCLLIFIDGSRFVREIEDEIKRYHILGLNASTLGISKVICERTLREIGRILRHFVGIEVSLPAIGIVFANSDILFDGSYDKIELYKQSVHHIARYICERLHSGMVFPTTVSMGRCIEKEFLVSPVNIELPILFAVLCIFKKFISRINIYTSNSYHDKDKMGVYKKFSAALLSIKGYLQKKTSILYMRSNEKVEENTLSNYADKILADLDSLFL